MLALLIASISYLEQKVESVATQIVNEASTKPCSKELDFLDKGLHFISKTVLFPVQK